MRDARSRKAPADIDEPLAQDAPSTSEHHQKARAMLAWCVAVSSIAWRGMSTTWHVEIVPMAWSISSRMKTFRSQKSPGTSRAMIWRWPSGRTL